MTFQRDERAFVEIAWDPQVSAFLAAALGADTFRKIQAAIAVPPLSTCLRVNTLKATTQEVMQQLQQQLSQQGVHFTPHPTVPMAILLKGSGPNQIDPQTAGVTKQVVISRKAGEAVLRGSQVFVPGVLAVSSGLAAGDVVAVMVALDQHGRPHSGITRGTILPPLAGKSSSISNNNNSNNVAAANEASCSWPANTSGAVAAAAAATATAAAAGSTPVAAAGGLLCIGLGRAAMGRVELFREQHGVAVQMQQRVYDVPSPSIEGPLKGSVMLQNLPSIVAAMVLNPEPGSRVLDMCAAPGGKTTMLGQLMEAKGMVVALDRSHAKVDDIKALAAELGCSDCVQAIKLDATKAMAKQTPATSELLQQQQLRYTAAQPPQQNVSHQQQQQLRGLNELSTFHTDDNHHHHQQPGMSGATQAAPAQQQPDFTAAGLSAKSLARLQRRIAAMASRGQQPPAAEYRLYGLGPCKHPGFPPESFDAVLLDAPCSALGLRPRLLQQHTLQLLLDTAAYQRALLAAAVQLLKPGGVMVYSTCTISPAENEMNVQHALNAYPCLQLVAAEPRIGGPGLTGPADRQAMAAAVAALAAGVTAAEAAEAAAEVGSSTPKTASSRLGRFNVSQCSGQWLSEAEAAMVQRFDPASPTDTIGFFIAKFIKTCSTTGG